MNHTGTVELQTKRLILRRFGYNDAEAAFRNWTSDPQVTEFLRWKNHTDISMTRSVADYWNDKYKDIRWYHWTIVPKDSGEPIGTISACHVDDETDTVEVGYCIGRKYWNNGYVTEALTEVIRFFLTTVGACRIEAKHDPRNPASGRVMEKCGMTYEGTLRRSVRSNKGVVDVKVYSILADEFS